MDEELAKYMKMWDQMRADGVSPVPKSELRPQSMSFMPQETPPQQQAPQPEPGQNGLLSESDSD